MQVVDPSTGRTLPVGQDGEVCFCGPHVMKGYWKRPDATAATIDKDGWLHSGKIDNNYNMVLQCFVSPACITHSALYIYNAL